MVHRRMLCSLGLTAALLTGACGGDSAPTTPEAGPVLTLSSEGIIVTAADGSTTATAFGAIEFEIKAKVAAELGEHTDEGRLPDCSPTAGYVAYPGLLLVLSDGIFEGWALRPGGVAPITTREGIGLGSTRADLVDAFPALVVDPGSALGVDFTAGGGLSGTLDGTGPDATVQALRAGQRCAFG